MAATDLSVMGGSQVMVLGILVFCVSIASTADLNISCYQCDSRNVDEAAACLIDWNIYNNTELKKNHLVNCPNSKYCVKLDWKRRAEGPHGLSNKTHYIIRDCAPQYLVTNLSSHALDLATDSSCKHHNTFDGYRRVRMCLCETDGCNHGNSLGFDFLTLVIGLCIGFSLLRKSVDWPK